MINKKSYFSAIILSVIFCLIIFLNSAQYYDIEAIESQECIEAILTWTDDGDGIMENGEYIRSGSPTEKGSLPACTSIDTGELGFKIPSLGDLLTFAIRAFFVIAGLAALFYLLLGALGWVVSGGDKDAVTAAREKIQAAVIGMILIVAVLAIIWTMEQVIFNRRICLGLSCSLTLPGLIEGNKSYPWHTSDGTKTQLTKDAFCCVCLKNDGTYGSRINTHALKCGPNGFGKSL